MIFEEREQQKRRHLIKVMIAEAGMVLAVLAIVGVAILAAMGFFVGSNGSIEQSGLIQIHSMPTGGTVELDGSVLFSRTNLSRTMSAGEHQIKISRDNYDVWEKTIKMYSGMLIRLYYPRLFLENRTPEEVLNLGNNLAFYSVSRDKTSIIYGVRDSAEWTLLNIKNDDVRKTQLDLTEVLPDAEDKEFSGEVQVLEWNKDSDHVLVKVVADKKTEWILVNLKDVSKSLNLSETFGLDFKQVEMMDHSAAQLFALENHHLRRINTSDQAISRVLLDQVLDFDTNGMDVIYVSERKTDEQKEKIVGVYRDGEKAGTVVGTFLEDVSVKVALTKYYDEDYLVVTADGHMTIQYGTLPSYREDTSELGENSDLKYLTTDLVLGATPETLAVSPDGEYIVGHSGTKYMVVDLDMGDLYEYELGTEKMRFFEDGMMSVVTNGDLEVFDFDHTNRRVLVKKVDTDEDELQAVTTRSKMAVVDYEAVIANNNKWLYYVVRSDKGLKLMREKVRD